MPKQLTLSDLHQMIGYEHGAAGLAPQHRKNAAYTRGYCLAIADTKATFAQLRGS